MSDNWIVQNLNSALNTWNEKLAEIWTLLTQSPESFKGGDIWSVITGINGALTAIGYGLLVLFFAAGIVKTCGSFTDMKKPEHALKAFIRFALAQGAIMYGMELMTALFSIVQGIVSTIMAQSGIHTTPHMLRRYFGNMRRDAGWPLEMISEAYGHKHIDTTIKYLNLVDDQLMEASDQYYAKHSALYDVEKLL